MTKTPSDSASGRRSLTSDLGPLICLWPLALAFAFSSCSESSGPTASGTLIVSSTAQIASDGAVFIYRIAVDSLSPIVVWSDEMDASFHIGPLVAGTHTVALVGLSSACTSGSDSREVTITGGDTTRVRFDIRCVRTTGDITVNTTTTGVEIDPDGYVLTLDGVVTRSVASGGTRSFLRVAAGTHTIAITDVGDNCVLAEPPSRSALVVAAQTTVLPVTVSCSAIGSGIAGFTVDDPAADTLPNAAANGTRALDLLSVSGRYLPGWLILSLRFSAPVTAARRNAASSLYGVIDLDVDENASTGVPPVVNSFGGIVSQGVDYEINFFSGDTSGAAGLVTAQGLIGLIAATYDADSVVLRIPLSKLGNDDGNLTLSGVIGTADRPTDLIPNAGVLAARRPIGLGISQARSPIYGPLLERVRPGRGMTAWPR
jgi:hypothetical protein